MIPEEVIQALQRFWKDQVQDDRIIEVNSISGGSINSAYSVKTHDNSYFLKFNTAAIHPQMFSSEFKGLQLLSKTSSIRIPKPLYYYEGQEYSFILMELIEEKEKEDFFWENFASQLAQMHQATSHNYGLDFDNYMGSLYQSNKYHDSFTEFFINERLLPQIKIARDKRLLNINHVKKGEGLFEELPSIFPIEKPALVHGDLWSGNFMQDENGKPVFMDPAVYYGHREVDIAMTTMFGGFSVQFYKSYHQFHPLEKGWESRLPYYNLYPILIHINLFGHSYVASLEKILKHF